MSVLIEKPREEIVVDIKENDEGDNLEDIKFNFLKNGITIIVGENNTGKTNLLNYVYEKSERWDNLNEEFLLDKESKLHYKKLPLFFEKEFSVFSEKYNENVWRMIGKEVDEKYYYKLYYFDLATAINPLTKDTQEVSIKRLKTRFCQMSIIKDRNKMVKIWRGASRTQEKSWEIDYGESRNFTRGRASNGIDEYDGYNPGMKRHHEIKKVGSGQLKYETLKDLLEKLMLEKSENRKQKPKEFYSSILLIDEPEVLLSPFRIKRMASLIKDVVKARNLTVILATHSPEFLSHFIYYKMRIKSQHLT
ncbi:MAG: hypothetical protein MRECE_29c017 [Mycoplasmataceae bacterium CE_OT135]|nr:MAG: hypothetical protein MRECE_29c017 [Mycoplasmataceae bacterium CE_OT135]